MVLSTLRRKSQPDPQCPILSFELATSSQNGIPFCGSNGHRYLIGIKVVLKKFDPLGARSLVLRARERIKGNEIDVSLFASEQFPCGLSIFFRVVKIFDQEVFVGDKAPVTDRNVFYDV